MNKNLILLVIFLAIIISIVAYFSINRPTPAVVNETSITSQASANIGATQSSFGGTSAGQAVPLPTSVNCSLTSNMVTQSDGTQKAELNWMYTNGANAQLNDGLGDAPSPTGNTLTPTAVIAPTTYTLTAATGVATSTCSTLATPSASAIQAAQINETAL